MASLCTAFSSMRVSCRQRVPGLQAQAPALSSKRCGINAAPKISAVVAPSRATPICTAIEAKLKTRKAMAKRYKVTGTGKVMRRHAGKQHCNEKKAHKRLKRLSKEESVFVGDVKNNIRRNLPYAKISLQKQREANAKHDARGPGHH